MGTILTYKEGRFLLKAHQIKNLDSSLWSPLSPGTYQTTNLKAAAEFRTYSDAIAERVFNRAFSKPITLPSLPPLTFLDPHQREGVAWILSRTRSYLAHAPGAGKTATAIVASCLAGTSGQTLFIVPPALTFNWEREIWKFTEPLGIYPTIGVVPKSDKKQNTAWRADFIICPDSLLTRPWVLDGIAKMDLKFLAVDEASRFKDPFAARSKVFYGGVIGDKHYAGIYQRAGWTVFLDGSPMPNRPMELWAPCYALDPESIDFLSYYDFGFRYCGAKMNDYGKWEFKHASNEEELHEKITKKFMHVVPEESLSHPERRRSILFMNEDVRSVEHKTWERKHLQSIKIDDLDEDSSQGDLARFRRELGVAKIDWVAKYVAERLENKNEYILLFAWHREVCEQLSLRLAKYNPGLIMGGVPNDKREKILENFQVGKSRLIVGNIQAMGRGHNLQKASRVIFAEYSWTDELNKQCEKRSSRRGNQSSFIRCEYIVSPNSMDEKVLNSNFTKQTRVRKVIG